MAAVGDLSEPERLAWDAFARGAPVDVGAGPADLDAGAAWGPERTVRAEVVRALLLGAGPAEPGYVPGVRLQGARITGPLDLAGATLTTSLACTDCWFDDEVGLAGASARAIRLEHCRLPGLDATRIRVDGILSLDGAIVAAGVRLGQARITGQLSLRGATAGPDAEGIAVGADGLCVTGDIDLTGLTADGAVSLSGAQVTGSADLTDAAVISPRAVSLNIGNASIGGRLIGRRLQVDGEMLLHDTVITRVELTDAWLHHPAGHALSAGGLTVHGGMFCGGGFTATGSVWLVGARLGGNLGLGHATLKNPGAVALMLDRAALGDLDATAMTCTGCVSLTGATVASGVSFDRASIDGGGGRAIDGDGMTVTGMLMLTGLRARGEVTLRIGQVGQRLMLTDAHLENPAGVALALSGTEVVSDVFGRRARITGEFRLVGTRIHSHLDLDQAELGNPGGPALSGLALQAGEVSMRTAEPIEGLVDLRHARIGVLRDDPDRWPDRLSLDGLTYAALEPGLPAADRLDWLRRNGPGPQPYEQLAGHYNGLGQLGEARRVLYARERIQRRGRAPLARAWSVLMDVTVAYGYEPWRALGWLALLLTAGSILFAVHPPPPLSAGLAPHFNPVIYTLDLLLPVVDLGQKHAFNPAGAEQWIAYLLTAAGWVLATTIAAGAARVLSRR